MKKIKFLCLLSIFVITGIILINKYITVKADEVVELLTEYGVVIEDDIIYREDFEDNHLAKADPPLTKGMTWTTNGDLVIEGNKTFGTKILRMNAGAYAISKKAIRQSEYTVSFTSINWYNTPARVMIEYQNKKNYYSFCPTTGQVYRMLDGIEKELIADDVSKILCSPRKNPSINYFKIYFRNNGKSIEISLDRDGYKNGKDYEYTYIDKKPGAVKLFKGGRIKLTRVDKKTSRYWVNFDNILVTKGKLQAALPRDPAKLYVSYMGDDSSEGTEAKPFKTISKAIEYSYPGDEIIVEDGVYDEQIKFASNRIYSEEDNRLILKSRNKRKASICSINLKHGNFVILDGFKAIGGSIHLGGSTGVEVINNYVYNVGVGITASGVNCRVAKNYIYKCSFGINVSGTDMLVENNEIERLIFRKGDADYFRFFGEGHIIRDNYMHGTRQEEIGKAHVDGFQTFDNNGEYARHIIIEGNLIEDFYHQGFMGSGRYYYHSFDITFRNNVFKDAAAWGLCISTLKDVKVYNNIFINMSQHGVGFSGNDEMPATGEVRNNIFYNASNCYFGLDKNKYASNNIVFRSDAYKKYDQESFPNDIVNKDPLFIDIDNNDFSLHPSSPAIDKGISLKFDHDTDGNSRPYGNAWDIGPYEYQGASHPLAYIQFSNCVSKNSGYEPFKVAFDGGSSYVPQGRSILTYEWDFGDGSTGSGVTTNHTFSAGKHTVKLTVTDSDGYKHTVSQKIKVTASKSPNLYLYLSFDKNCLDASGKKMTIESSKDILFKKSIYGKSIRFNNSKSRGILVKHNDYLDGIDEITFAFFAKKDKKNTAATVLHKHTVYGTQITANGFAGSITTTSGTGKYLVAKVVNDTKWHHYAITYDGSNIITYLDGKQCSRTELSGRIRRDSSRAIVIGRNPWGASFEGLLDEIRIYDRALSKEEIKQLISIKP
ncbi:MAG: PKD domain-containing protein [Herbinix sp.]|nr:PKD domain-containing protein [Herbinix sp.]